jgi:glyoxylase-like metal-dependent hydrolase (beta-lactamase superfamily II)
MPALTRAIGDITATRIEEQLGPGFDPALMFPDFDPAVIDEHRHWLVPHHYDEGAGRFISSIHSWLLRVGGQNILIDTCSGNHKERPGFDRFHMLDTPWLDRLADAGVAPEEIDMVLCTHLHVDHAGWNTRLEDGRWVPTFPNAKYVFSHTDHAFWEERFKSGEVDVNSRTYQDSVLPVVAAGQAMMIDGEHDLAAGLLVEPAPGHTPGHVLLKAESGGDRALFSGDIMHQAIQVYYPDWNSMFCELPDEARATRRRVLEHCAETGALLMPAHFGYPHVARIGRAGDGFTADFSV